MPYLYQICLNAHNLYDELEATDNATFDELLLNKVQAGMASNKITFGC